jgi:hypothetical protein
VGSIYAAIGHAGALDGKGCPAILENEKDGKAGLERFDKEPKVPF